MKVNGGGVQNAHPDQECGKNRAGLVLNPELWLEIGPLEQISAWQIGGSLLIA
jgi:hypothetical protein